MTEMPRVAPVEQLVLEVLCEHEAAARERRVSFQVEADLRLAASIDPAAFRSILDLLVVHAVATSPRGGAIRICAQPDRDEALVSIKHDGLPAPEAALGRAEELVRGAGGRVWENSALERGVTFYFALRRWRPALEPPARRARTAANGAPGSWNSAA